MKVLNSGQHFFIKGGSDKYLMLLGDLLEKNGHEVIPFTSANPNNHKTKWSNYFPQGVDTNYPKPLDKINFIYSIQAKKNIKKLLESTHIDIAHLHIYYAQLTASVLQPLKDKNIPIIQSLHDFKLECPVSSFISNGSICEDCSGGKFYKALAKRCNRESVSRTIGSIIESYASLWLGNISKIDHFIAVCDFQKNKLIEHNVVKEDKISTLYNFVDCEIIEPSFENDNYILYFGRIENIKGIKTLIKASEKLPHIPLLIVGDGNLRPELENYLDNKKITHIKFLGFKSGTELESIIKKSAFTILPSECYELCPLSLLESFAYGKPVIGSSIGGIPELIDNESDGLLFEAGNYDDLSAKINTLFSDTNRIIQMGEKGRKKVIEKFNPEAHYIQLMKIYQKVLDRVNG